MAGGRARSNKRSSNSTCSTTVTTITIAAMCVMGLWLLSPSSITSPLSTTRTAITAASTTTAAGESNGAGQKTPVFDDSEENLPDDAVKQDESKKEEVGNEGETNQGNDNANVEENNQQKSEDVEKEAEQEHESHGKTSKEQIEHDEEVVENEDHNQTTYQEQQQSNKETQERHEEREQHESRHGKTSKDQIEHDEEVVANQNQDEQATQESEEQHESHGKTSKDQIEHDEDRHEANDQTVERRHNKNVVNKEEDVDKENDQTVDGHNNMGNKQDQNRGYEHKEYKWKLCNETAGADYIPCLDNEAAVKKLRSRKHFEHRERHCPDEAPMCLVPLPKGYKKPVKWPQSRDKIWYANVPRTELAKVKGHQNWMKVTGEFLTFPGGGTQFIHGAMHYIDFLQEAVPEIAWGKHTRVILDIGCGVASFGGYLFKKDVITMSVAPKDEHEAQIQFALERGIPAMNAVMGSQRLSFPSKVFDLIQCSRCRIPWHADGGLHLLEVDRVLRPGGFFVWSETPVYQTLPEDVQQWKDMTNLTTAMCWEIVAIKKDKLNSVGAAIYQKPNTNECYEKRKQKSPPMCKNNDDPNASWYVPLQTCIHRIPTQATERGTEWPEEWPHRLETPPYWLSKSQTGVYGKPAPQDFTADYEHWKQVVRNLYRRKLGINWSDKRNIMDMRAVYGGFAAALKDLEVWVMNVVNADATDTLPIIFERGLLGIRHDWCEASSTYPRTYDLLHADHLFSKLKNRCSIVPVVVEVDRIVRPEGNLIVKDDSNTINEVKNLLNSLHWEVNITFSSNDEEGILSAHKSYWRPDSYVVSS